MNIAIVVLDTLRYDYFSQYFDWLPGTRFTQAYSTSHWTIPSHASLYTGYYPSEIGVHGKQMKLNCEKPVLPEHFEELGYSTRLFTANPQIYMWDGWQRGYQEAIGPSNLKPKDDDLADWEEFYSNNQSGGLRKYVEALLYTIKSDSPIVRSIWHGFKLDQNPADGGIQAIKQRVSNLDFGEDEFLFLNIMESHTPYNPPADYATIESPIEVVTGDGFSDSVENPEKVKEAYDASARYLSDEYRELFHNLREDFDYIITLADHGEMLGEYGMWNHSYGLYPELTHIPLVISGNGIESESIDTVVSILDVHKTICEFVGINTESRGQDLLSNPTSRDHVMEYHGLLHWHKEQFKRKGLSEEVYERRNNPLDGFVSQAGDYVYDTHDEGLQINGDITESTAQQRLNGLLGEFNRNQNQYNDAPEEITDEVRDRLEDLGYA